MKQKSQVLWLIALLGIILAACASNVDHPTTFETAIATNTPQPTSSRTLLPSSTATIAPSPISTATLTRTRYPTYTKTVSPTPYPLVTPPAGLFYSIGDVLWRIDANYVRQMLWEAPEHSSFKVSPDGKRVLDTNNWIVHDFSSNQDTNLSIGKDYSFCSYWSEWWETVSNKVLVGAIPTEEYGQGMYCQSVPAIINLIDGSYTILADEISSIGPSVPSPNGQAVAFDIRCNPWIYSLEKGTEEFNVEAFGYYPERDVCISHPAWSPSGRYLAWIMSTDEQSKFGSGIGNIGIFDLTNRTAIILQDYLVEGFDGGRSWLFWSPDEDYIVLDNFGWNLLGVIPIDGSETNIIEPAGDPAWSPTSQWLAYRADGKIWVLLPKDRKSFPVGKGYDSFWSPDGNWLIFSDNDGSLITQTGVWELKQIDLPKGANIVDWLPIY
jgi:hypothetical protein